MTRLAVEATGRFGSGLTGTRREPGSLLASELERARQTVEGFLGELKSEPLGKLVPRLVAAKAHLLRGSGKLVRPLIVSLLGRALGVSAARLEPYALAVELIHTASLLHDDVIDRSMRRRGRPTANATYDNTLPVLAGDAVLAEVMARIAAVGDLVAIRRIAACIQTLVSGESLQYERLGQAHGDLDFCLEVAELKTAALISLCTWVPAHLAGLGDDGCDALAALGRHTGIAYQLIDDVLDFDAGQSGKNPFADWAEAKTNAVSAVLVRLRPGAQPVLQELFADRRRQSPLHCQAILDEHFGEAVLAEACREVEALAAYHAQSALRHAVAVPPNEAGQCFDSLREGLLSRRS